jgi:hypothetical protein
LGGNGKTSWAIAGIAKPALNVRVSNPPNSFRLMGGSFETGC